MAQSPRNGITRRRRDGAYEKSRARLRERPRCWLVTGAAGFIGSNLVEALLKLDQHVVGFDNFSTGHQANLDEISQAVGGDRWTCFKFIEGDARELAACRRAVAGCNFVLHQAALGSVPRSLDDPIETNAVNIDGFVNMLVAARDAQIERFVYAASSSTYGDHPALPKVESRIGRPLSPYAVTKYVNELYADVFGRCYGLHSIGLRYFNVFGPRQDPNGAYAAVIPRWVAAILNHQPVSVFGDGETSRDFCFVDNAVQANILAAVAPESAAGQVYNVAVGERTTLNQLFSMIHDECERLGFDVLSEQVYEDFRKGDVRHSLADISKARKLLDYEPTHSVRAGLEIAMPWYINFFKSAGVVQSAKSSIAIEAMPNSSRSFSK